MSVAWFGGGKVDEDGVEERGRSVKGEVNKEEPKGVAA